MKVDNNNFNFNTANGLGVTISQGAEFLTSVEFPICELETPIKLSAGSYNVGKIGAFTVFRGKCKINNTASIGRFSIIEEDVVIGLPYKSSQILTSHYVFYGWDLKWCEGFSDLDYNSKSFHRNRHKANLLNAGINKPVIIGNAVIIETRVIVGNGVTIGDGAIIKSNSVVTENVEPFTIVEGNPARVVSKRYEESIIERLIEIEWWKYGTTILKDVFLSDPAEFIPELQNRIQEGIPEYSCDTFYVDIANSRVVKRPDISSDMVLYQASHPGILAKCVIHRLTKNIEKKAVLLVAQGLMCNISNNELVKYKQAGVFDEVIFYPQFKAARAKTMQEALNVLSDVFESAFNSSPFRVTDFSDIYTGTDTYHDFAIYCAYKLIPHTIFEGYKGAINAVENRYDRFDKEHDTKGYAKALQYYDSLGGTHPTTKSVLIYPGQNINNPQIAAKAEIFDMSSLISTIKQEEWQKIFWIYGFDFNKFRNEKYSILLGRSKWNIRNEENYEIAEFKINNRYLDFYVKKNVFEDTKMILKPHPLILIDSDKYRTRFPSLIVLEPTFPIEYFIGIEGIQIENVYDIDSTGVIVFEKKTSNIHRLGWEFYTIWKDIVKIYSILRLTKINKSKINELYVSEIDLGQVNLLSQRSDIDDAMLCLNNVSEFTGNGIIITSSITDTLIEKYLTSDAKVLFWLRNDTCKTDLLKNCYVVSITKKFHYKNDLQEDEVELVYMICKDKDILNAMKQEEFTKTLRFSGYDFTVKIESG